MFYDTFQAYKTSEVDEASIPDPRQEAAAEAKKDKKGVMGLNKKQKAPNCRRGQDGDGVEREAESPCAATKAKKEENERMRLVEGLTEPCRI